jgi:hypothetical protein
MIELSRGIFLVFTAAALCVEPGCKSGTKSGASEAGVIHLLGGNDLSGFYTYLKESGINKDPDSVFLWTNGVLRISGQHFGYVGTMRQYANYKLVAEFKWGDVTWAPRQFKARDGGILLNATGKDQIWPKAIECQMIEGGAGSILVVNGASLTVNGVTKGPHTERFDRPGRNPWKDVLGYRGTNEIESPHGEWNTLEVVCAGGEVGVAVNGHQTLSGKSAKPAKGKILLKSEGAEVFFRKLDLYPIK